MIFSIYFLLIVSLDILLDKNLPPNKKFDVHNKSIDEDKNNDYNISEDKEKSKDNQGVEKSSGLNTFKCSPEAL